MVCAQKDLAASTKSGDEHRLATVARHALPDKAEHVGPPSLYLKVALIEINH